MKYRNILTLITFIYSVCVYGNPQIKVVEKILSQQGVEINSVRISLLKASYDKRNRSKAEVLKPINLAGISLPVGSILEYEEEYLSKVHSSIPVKVGEYYCQNGHAIGFQYGKLCRCYLSEDISDKNTMIPKKTDLIFQGGVLVFLNTSGSWRYGNKDYEKGAFNIVSEKEVVSLSDTIFSQDLCVNISNKSMDKAIAVLKQLKIDLSDVKIIDTFETQDLDEDYYYHKGHNIQILIMNPIQIEKVKYPKKTVILIVDKVIREIELPRGQTIKVSNQFKCSGKIEKYSDGKICSCEISQDTLIKGYKIKPPATLYFNADGFEIFRNFNKYSMERGFYKINNNGKAVINLDTEYFHCND